MKDQFADANLRRGFIPADGDQESKDTEQYRTKGVIPQSIATAEDSDPGKASTLSAEREHPSCAA